MANDIQVKAGEHITLSPTSDRFAPFYKSVRPKDIDEVRKLIGPKLRPEFLGRFRSRIERRAARYTELDPATGVYRIPELSAIMVSKADLKSRDKKIQARAHDMVYRAAKEYVYGDHQSVAQWKPLINAWLAVEALIRWIEANTVEIGDGGSLTISKNTLALYAWKIKMHGSGKIICEGDTTINVTTSLEGNL